MASGRSSSLPTPGRATIVRAGEAPAHDLRFGRGRSEMLVGPHLGAEQLLVHRVVIGGSTEPGPYHRHDHADNVYLALEGDVEVLVDGRTERLRPGDAIFIPAGHPHATHNPSDAPAVLLAIYDRPIEHDFVRVDLDGAAG